MTKRAIAVTLALISGTMVLNAGILDRIKKSWEDRDLEKTEKLILKSLEKDSLNPGARYYYSLLFLDSAFERHDIDSSSYFIERSILGVELASVEILEDFLKAGLTKAHLYDQRNRVGRAAFRRAEQLMAIEALEDFMQRFSYSDRLSRATTLRDSLAFDHTRTENTWQAYEKYFVTYPESEYVPEARERYQRLIFKDYTKDDQLESYIEFLRNHPDTPYRRLAEAIIFERSTQRNLAGDYLNFAKQYPNSHLRKKATDIAYYLEGAGHISQQVHRWHPGIDSLTDLNELEKQSLFPVYEKEKFGFVTTTGDVMIPPRFDGLQEEYLCGNISDNWLKVTQNQRFSAISRKGEVIVSDIIDFKSISRSVKLVFFENSHLYHASGFKIMDLIVDDAVELTNGWIAFKHNYLWGIASTSGYQILPPSYESIVEIGPFVLLESEDVYTVSTFADLLANKGKNLNDSFDDFELVQDTLLQVFDGKQEAVIDQNLQYIVKPDEHEIYINGSFWYLKTPEGYKMVNEEESGVINQVFQSVEVNDGWLAFKKPEEWLLISRKSSKALVLNGLDSVRLLNDYFAFSVEGGVETLLTHNGQKLEVGNKYGIKVLNADPTYGESAYLVLSQKNDRIIYDQFNQQLFTALCDEITLLTDSIFKRRYQGKLGLTAATGKEMISTKYEALDIEGDLVFLLRNGKIGCYDMQNEVLIPTEYATRIKRIGPFYQVSKDGLFGLVGMDNRPMFPAEYDEMKPWNDSSLWVRTNSLWQLISPQGDVYIDKIQSLKMWMKVGDEQLAIILGADGSGLISSRNGEILAPQYNEIINVGSETEPVFFAEQHLKTAAFFVVTYFNLQGKTLKSQAFRPEEYDQIYCDQ